MRIKLIRLPTGSLNSKVNVGWKDLVVNLSAIFRCSFFGKSCNGQHRKGWLHHASFLVANGEGQSQITYLHH